jgi:hypothetical protein
MMICASVARGGDVKIKAVMTTGPEDEPTTVFQTDTPKVLALFKANGAKKGDKLRGVWIADDVGDAAPANTKIDEKTLTLEGDTDGDFSCSKPTKGWPAGKYHVDIYANDELATTVKFTIEAAEKTEKKEPKESADEPGYKFTVHNTTQDRITKLLTSEDGKDYGSFDIGRKGIGPGETTQLVWDEKTETSGCEWFIKAVFSDGSKTPAKKFDFCEEDLELEF